MAKKSGPPSSKKRQRSSHGPPTKKKPREVVFDPEARKAYLRGFSERKRQRRAYGLAMQKVKDRKAKLEERKQTKKDEMQRVEEAEKQKAAFIEAVTGDNKNNEDDSKVERDIDEDSSTSTNDIEGEEMNSKTYDDQATESHWGGTVTVTTAAVELGDSDSSDDEVDPASKSVDRRQRYAGNVDKFMAKLKGNLPGKKKGRDSNQPAAKRKGRNGAAEMRGIGGAANLKMALKVLNKAKAKSGQGGTGKGKMNGKKGRR